MSQLQSVFSLFLSFFQFACVNFSDSASYFEFLEHLGTNLREFKTHEEIENSCIMSSLLPRLPHQAKLENDLHSHSLLGDLQVRRPEEVLPGITSGLVITIESCSDINEKCISI